METSRLLYRRPIDHGYLATVYDLATSNDIATAGLEKLVAEVMRGGVNISMRVFETKEEMPPEMKNIQQRLEEFFRDFTRSIFRLGFAVVEFITPGRDITIRIPQVAHFGTWDLEMVFEPGKERSYNIYRRYPDDAGGTSKLSAQQSPREEYRGARVYAHYPPNEFGKLQSPFALMEDKLRILSSVWLDILKASKSMACPQQVVSRRRPTGPQRGVTNPLDNERWADDRSNQYRRIFITCGGRNLQLGRRS